MFMDITERKRAEAERLKIDKLEALGVLAGGLAHDLNNVLMGILGNLSLANGALSARELETRLAAAEAACGQAQTLARHLLTFAKGGTPIKQPQDLKELVQEAGKLAVCGSSAKIEFDLPEDLWAVEVDRGQMHQVFSNLLINAVQAMLSGGIIRVRAANVELTETTGFPLPAGQICGSHGGRPGGRHHPGKPRKNLRPVLYHQKAGHRAGSGHHLRHHQPARRPHLRDLGSGTGAPRLR